MRRPYKANLKFNGKQFEVIIHMHPDKHEDGEYHYDIELFTQDKISGDEFQKLRKYLKDEGYIEAAATQHENCK